MKNYRELVQIQSIERHGLSYYGNPTLRICFTYSDDNGCAVYQTAKTQSNAQCGYSFSNYKEGDWLKIEYHFTKNDNCIITRILR